MQDRIQAALSCLLGHEMWAAGYAASILWLQFGPEQLTVDLRGEPRTVGRYAVHIDCPWRWLEGWGEVRADHGFEEVAFLGAGRPVCSVIRAQSDGGFTLGFSDGSELHVEPDDREQAEYWRLLEPGRLTDHFVVGSHGIEA